MSASRSRPGTGLLDRDRERAAVDGVLDQARAGSSAVLVLRGEPGIGKTALLGYAAGRALSFRVLHCAGRLLRSRTIIEILFRSADALRANDRR